MEKVYDIVIVGGGPAGLTSAIYASRAKMDVLVIEKEGVGSLIQAHKIENYPGFPEGISGIDLHSKMKKQAEKFGSTFVKDVFLELDVSEYPRVVKCSGNNYKAKSVILAAGWPKNNAKKLPGEQEMIGKGVSYCATCDGFFTKNRVVSVFGSGKELVEEALFLTKFAKEVLVYIDDNKIDCDDEMLSILENKENLKITLNSKLLEIKGQDYVETVVVDIDGDIREINADYAFLYLGTKSNEELYASFAKLDKEGYIVTGEDMACMVEGVYAVGDIRAKERRQVTTAVADGTIAGMVATAYIARKNKASNN
jgi:thioredoxin reductase (NADPH)